MRCIAINAFGDADQLRPTDLPAPHGGDADVLIRVAAAGVGPWDVKQRQGLLGDVPFPYVLGWEVAGIVEAVGAGVSAIERGDEVFTYCYPGGGYAELTVSPEAAVARKPSRLTFAEAAAVPVAGLTAHQGLIDELGLEPGETVLITGAAGGVGTFAVQIAAGLGARVIGAASAANHAYLRDLGADEAIDYRTPDWPADIRRTASEGVNAVLDCVGGATLSKAMAAVRDGGRVATIVDPQPPPGSRKIRVHYFIGAPDGGRLATLARMFDAGELRVEIQETLPLEQARIAHERIATGHTRGKIVLDVASMPAH